MYSQALGRHLTPEENRRIEEAREKARQRRARLGLDQDEAEQVGAASEASGASASADPPGGDHGPPKLENDKTVNKTLEEEVASFIAEHEEQTRREKIAMRSALCGDALSWWPRIEYLRLHL